MTAATPRRRAFTLTELMVAVAVLVVIILATSRIFGTVNQVTSVGSATADLLQEAAAIERQIRSDFRRMSREGFFAIQCNAVANDVNGVLLNPALPDDAVIRADQLVFFTQGLESIQNIRLKPSGNIGSYQVTRGQATASRIYYGHAFQLPLWPAFDAQDDNGGFARDLAPDANLYPWYVGTAPTVTTKICTSCGDNFTFSGAAELDATQPPAREWLLARQSVVLADDDLNGLDANSKTVFLNFSIAGRSVFLNDPVIGFEPQVRDGRVDAAATQLNDIYNHVTNFNSASWLSQRNVIRGRGIYFPRAERIAPSAHRSDQGLTMPVIGSACSSFIVEWTYDDRVGEAFSRTIGFQRGTFVERSLERPWFGYPDPDRGVQTYRQWNDETGNGAFTVDPDNIEENFANSPEGLYTAVFGYNQTKPFVDNGVLSDTSDSLASAPGSRRGERRPHHDDPARHRDEARGGPPLPVRRAPAQTRPLTDRGADS